VKTCPAGHPRIESNLYTFRHSNGREYQACRTCQRRRLNLKYRHDDEWREKVKTKNLERYYRNKSEEHANG